MAIEIKIPKLGLRAPVIDIPLTGETWAVDELTGKVGRLEGTASFESSRGGNIVLTGYVANADGDPDVFEEVDSLAGGDEVLVLHDDNVQRYQVTATKRVPYDDMSVVAPTPERRLTLVAVVPDTYDESLGDYLERHIICAEPVPKAADHAEFDKIVESITAGAG